MKAQQREQWITPIILRNKSSDQVGESLNYMSKKFVFDTDQKAYPHTVADEKVSIHKILRNLLTQITMSEIWKYADVCISPEMSERGGWFMVVKSSFEIPSTAPMEFLPKFLWVGNNKMTTSIANTVMRHGSCPNITEL